MVSAGARSSTSVIVAACAGLLAVLAFDWLTGSYVHAAPLGFVLVAIIAAVGQRSLALLLCCGLAFGRLWVERCEVLPYDSTEMALNALIYLVSLVFVALLVDGVRGRRRTT